MNKKKHKAIDSLYLYLSKYLILLQQMSLWMRKNTSTYSKKTPCLENKFTSFTIHWSDLLLWRRSMSFWIPYIYSHSILNAISDFFSSHPVKCQADVYESGKTYGTFFQNKLEISCDDFIAKISKKHISNNIDVVTYINININISIYWYIINIISIYQ